MYIFILLLVLIIVFLYLFRSKKEKFDIPDNSFEQLKDTIQSQFNKPDEPSSEQIINNLELSKKEPLANRLKKFKELTQSILDQKMAEDLYFELRMNENIDIRKRLVKGIFIYKSILENNSTTPEYNKLILNIINDYAKNNKFTKSKYEYLI
jgi:hypothetical protein